MTNFLKEYKNPLAIGLVWLFHLSALIGISMGYLDWFIPKTPLNLLVCFLLFLWVFPIKGRRKIMALVFFFAAGFLAEWLGVNYGLLFGEYAYGGNFGPKLGGVPLLIGANWALLTFITAAIVDYTPWNNVSKALLAAILMIFLDFLMEFHAPRFDFWEFEGGLAPLDNYVTWFGLALLFQAVFRYLGLGGNKRFSLHLYLAQTVFFMFFFLY